MHAMYAIRMDTNALWVHVYEPRPGTATASGAARRGKAGWVGVVRSQAAESQVRSSGGEQGPHGGERARATE